MCIRICIYLYIHKWVIICIISICIYHRSWYISYILYICIYIIYHRMHHYRMTFFFNGRAKCQWRDHLKWRFLAEFTNYWTIYTDVIISHGTKHVLPQSAQPLLMSSSMLTGYSCVTPRFSIYPWFQWLSQLEHCQSAYIEVLQLHHLKVNSEQNHITSLEN